MLLELLGFIGKFVNRSNSSKVGIPTLIAMRLVGLAFLVNGCCRHC